MIRRRVRCFLSACLLCCTSFSRPVAALDESPLPVDVVDAFPGLAWPDDLTGLDEGRRRDSRPLWIGGAGDGTNRLFVASQYGAIYEIVPDGDAHKLRLVLDIRERVQYADNENEEGFLGLAFHPKFHENGEVYVNYTASRANDPRRRSLVSRFKRTRDDPLVLDPASEEVVMDVPQPYWNHNGGTVVFGPDDYLYICFGDGGAADDPHMNGQNLRSLLGKVLRIDVDRREQDRAYAIPRDNPFVDQPAFACGEVWAYGLRNVWRLSFDRETGVAWAGDVGQNIWEEIDVIERGGNYGWKLREGKHAFGPFGWPQMPQLIEPIWDYHHDVGKSVTGGCVYRGPGVPELAGYYLYADYVAGKVWGLNYDFDRKEVVANRLIRETGGAVTSFGEADDGEVYFTTVDGGLFRFAARGGQAQDESHATGRRPGVAAQGP